MDQQTNEQTKGRTDGPTDVPTDRQSGCIVAQDATEKFLIIVIFLSMPKLAVTQFFSFSKQFALLTFYSYARDSTPQLVLPPNRWSVSPSFKPSHFYFLFFFKFISFII